MIETCKEDMTAIGTRLKMWRMRAGVTQDDAAGVVGVTRVTISNWEAGRHLPNLLQLKVLLGLYGCTGNQVLFEQDPFALSKCEMAELMHCVKYATPELQRRVEMLAAVLVHGTVHNAPPPPAAVSNV